MEKYVCCWCGAVEMDKGGQLKTCATCSHSPMAQVSSGTVGRSRIQRITQPMHPVPVSGQKSGSGQSMPSKSTAVGTGASPLTPCNFDEEHWGLVRVRDADMSPKCECGAEKCKTTHANWCPKWKEF